MKRFLESGSSQVFRYSGSTFSKKALPVIFDAFYNRVRHINNMLSRWILPFVLIAFGSQTLFAYLEPQTGSLLIQSLLAFGMGAIYLIKIYWKKIVTFLKKPEDGKKSEDEQKS